MRMPLWHRICLTAPQQNDEGNYTMIELVMTVCIVTQPATCRDQRMLFDASSTPMQCMMAAQPTIAQWGTEHPRWFVQRWKCQYPRKGAKDI